MRVRVSYHSGSTITAVIDGGDDEYVERNGEPIAEGWCYLAGHWCEVPIYCLEQLAHRAQVAGPAIIIQDTATIVVEPNCCAKLNDQGDVVIDVETAVINMTTDLDPIQLALFSHRFMSIAEQMGYTLQRTAISTNIKERCDFSCALFSATGDLIANAPHTPVHLGAMSEAVRQQLERYCDDMVEGDVWLCNHPQSGGSHLPDITVITPLWYRGKMVMVVANRGHHADIGGITPGSMPPFSRSLKEEGCAIRGMKLVRAGVFQQQEVEAVLSRSNVDDDGNSISATRL